MWDISLSQFWSQKTVKYISFPFSDNRVFDAHKLYNTLCPMTCVNVAIHIYWVGSMSRQYGLPINTSSMEERQHSKEVLEGSPKENDKLPKQLPEVAVARIFHMHHGDNGIKGISYFGIHILLGHTRIPLNVSTQQIVDCQNRQL